MRRLKPASEPIVYSSPPPVAGHDVLVLPGGVPHARKPSFPSRHLLLNRGWTPCSCPRVYRYTPSRNCGFHWAEGQSLKHCYGTDSSIPVVGRNIGRQGSDTDSIIWRWTCKYTRVLSPLHLADSHLPLGILTQPWRTGHIGIPLAEGHWQSAPGAAVREQERDGVVGWHAYTTSATHILHSLHSPDV